MKKTAIALGIAAALGISAAQSDTTLYGSARVSVDYDDLDVPDGSEFEDPDANWDVVNNTSRLGVEGSEDLGGGLSAIYQYEFGIDITEGGSFESNRPKWVGLQGGFGAVTLGTQYTPYYDVVGINDFFESAKTFDVDIYLYPNAATREANSVIYESPDFAGFSLKGMVVADGLAGRTNGLNDRSGIDRWNIGAKYQNGPFFAGLTYAAFRDNNLIIGDEIVRADDTDLWAAGIGVQFGDFTINFTHENGDASAVYGDAKNYLLTAAYELGNTTLALQYGIVDPDEADNVDYFVAHAEHHLSKRSHLWVEYIGRRDDNNSGQLLADLGDRDAVSVGVRHDF